eukprot:4024916-Pyramimonas_sp.AAC.1
MAGANSHMWLRLAMPMSLPCHLAIEKGFRLPASLSKSAGLTRSARAVRARSVRAEVFVATVFSNAC